MATTANTMRPRRLKAPIPVPRRLRHTNATTERFRSEPSASERIAELDAGAKRTNEEIDKLEKYKTAAYIRLGLILICLRTFFRKGWESHLALLGIDQTRWQRAKCLAEYNKDNETWPDLPLDDALTLAGFGQKQRQNHKPKTARRKEPHPVAAETLKRNVVDEDDLFAVVATADIDAEAQAEYPENDDPIAPAPDNELSTAAKELVFTEAVMSYAADVGWKKAREVFDKLENGKFFIEEV